MKPTALIKPFRVPGLSAARQPAYWAARGEPGMARLMALERYLERRFPGLHLNLGLPEDRYVSINGVRVDSRCQGQGIGSAVIRAVQCFAQGERLLVALTPCADPGKKIALVRFYRRHGFTPNAGRARNAAVRFEMVWRPGLCVRAVA